MGKLFGTDGIRGIANKEITSELAVKVGMALAKLLNFSYARKPKIFIGKDTRISSDMIEASIISGVCSMGCEAISLGVIPTPGVAFLVRKHSADAGIMISASHNSFEFNGIKIFDKNGYKLSDELEEKMESMILNEKTPTLPLGENIGKLQYAFEYKQEYIKYLSESVNLPKCNFKVLVDCSNGSASFTAKELFSHLRINADFIYENPNGININENCGSTNIENLSERVVQGGYNLGVAFDGDADRCLAIDDKGKIIDGDAVLGICAGYMKSKGDLPKNTLVGTIMSNLGLKNFCKEKDISFKETKVGDRYVLEKMLEGGYCLGGEQSGHVIFKNHSTTGDGQLTALKLIEVIMNLNKSSSSLNGMIKKYPQKSSSIDILPSQKGLVSKSTDLKKYLEKIQKEILADGRIVVRESGTEPKIRIMAEHKDPEKLQKLIVDTTNTIKKFIERN